MKLKQLLCRFFGHDPKIIKAINEGDKFIATYRCDCGKEQIFDETNIRLPYVNIVHKFNNE